MSSQEASLLSTRMYAKTEKTNLNPSSTQLIHRSYAAVTCFTQMPYLIPSLPRISSHRTPPPPFHTSSRSCNHEQISTQPFTAAINPGYFLTNWACFPCRNLTNCTTCSLVSSSNCSSGGPRTCSRMGRIFGVRPRIVGSPSESILHVSTLYNLRQDLDEGSRMGMRRVMLDLHNRTKHSQTAVFSSKSSFNGNTLTKAGSTAPKGTLS